MNINEENNYLSDKDLSNEEIEDENSYKNSNVNSEIKSYFNLFKIYWLWKKYLNNNKFWWPVKLSYEGKKYYIWTHNSYISKKTANTIFYFCNNHRINIINKKFLLWNNKCNGKNEYQLNTNHFYLVYPYNDSYDIYDKKI